MPTARQDESTCTAALAAYVTAGTVRVLAGDAGAGHSVPGIVLAAVSLAVMPVLSAAQRRAGRELGSASAVADSRQTLLCTCLSAVLLAGLLLDATLGWSWAGPVAALLIAVAAIREGISAWQGKGCCAAPAAAASTSACAGTAQTEECGCRPGCQCCTSSAARTGCGHSG
jgi:drug/metabolite transporter (DMT)-like permease